MATALVIGIIFGYASSTNCKAAPLSGDMIAGPLKPTCLVTPFGLDCYPSVSAALQAEGIYKQWQIDLDAATTKTERDIANGKLSYGICMARDSTKCMPLNSYTGQ